MFRGGLHAARAAAPACLLVLAALAGCASGAEPEADDDGSLKADIVDDGSGTAGDETGEAPKLGRVAGAVLHPTGAPLADAHITVLSVDHSLVTDGNGTFSFDDVPAGDQTLRVEKENYKTLQRPFEVVAGKLTRIEVVLTPTEGGGFSEHYHDRWRGQDTYTVFDGTLSFDNDIQEVPPHYCFSSASFSIDRVNPPTKACYILQVAPEEDRIVPPGTSKIVADIEFEPGALFDRERMQFRMLSPRDSEGKSHNDFQDVESGDERIEYELPTPEIVDHGHAQWTDWEFSIFWSTALEFSGAWYDDLFRGPVEVTITTHKGALPLDPPHQRYWQDGDRLHLNVSQPSEAWCFAVAEYNCADRDPNPFVSTSRDETTCRYGCMTLEPGHTVPPGTTRVEFSVRHFWADALAPEAAPAFEEDDFVIGYKTASPHTATWDDYTWLEPVDTSTTDEGTVWSYELDVEDQTDPYYQKNTRWMLMAAVRGHEDADDWSDIECTAEACGRANFELLDFVAINDDWDGTGA